MSAYVGNIEIVQYLVEQGADIHAENDQALINSAGHGHLDIVKYFIIDCNMFVKEETLEYLNKNNLLEALNIINARNLYNNLNNNLNCNQESKKPKLKV